MLKQDDFIRSLGFEAYRVGGSVRDELLGKTPKDADYMVREVDLLHLGSALERAGAKISPIKLRQGGQFGWRAAVKGLGLMEIALPRTETSTGRGRSMDVRVDPALPLEEDAKRRDFTFNAIYREVVTGASGIMDPTGKGLYDLQHRLVRTTHPESFRDDPLRTLRALRFHARGFDLAITTLDEMSEYAEEVDGLTARGYTSGTLYDEFCKILEGDYVAVALRTARDTGVLAVAIPEVRDMIGFEQKSRYHDLTVDEHTFRALDTAAKVEAPLRVRWALLFHDAGKPATAWYGADGRRHYYANPEQGIHIGHEDAGELLWCAFASRANVPRRMREDVATLIRNHMVPAPVTVKPHKVRRMRVKFGDEMLRDLYLHRMCDITGKDGGVSKDALYKIGQMEGIRQGAEKTGVPASRRHLAITGADCMDAALTGRDIGRALDDILDEVVVDPSPLKLSREWQLQRLEATHEDI